MSVNGFTLVIPEKGDEERDAVGAAWVAAGGTVLRLDRFWDPPPLDPGRIRLYGNDTFALVLAQKLGLELISPPDDLLAKLPHHHVKRDIALRTLREASTIHFPIFAKPAVPKLFRAAVYSNSPALLEECKGLAADTAILTSQIVQFTAEARAWVLSGKVLDVALYEGDANLEGAEALLLEVAAFPGLPATCVLDAGYIEGCGWAVVEANAAWGAGLNGCDAARVLPAIAAATQFATCP